MPTLLASSPLVPCPLFPASNVMLPTSNSVCMSPQICPLAFWLEWPKVVEPGPCCCHYPYKPRCSACGMNWQGETDIRHPGQNEHMEGNDFPVAVKGGLGDTMSNAGCLLPPWVNWPTHEGGREIMDQFFPGGSLCPTMGTVLRHGNSSIPTGCSPQLCLSHSWGSWEMFPSSGSASIPASCFPENTH